jgi:Copper type II ascorbate-dependent monooxygenase, C-terminal domain
MFEPPLMILVCLFLDKGLHAVRQEAYEFKPGDTYRTTCFYRSENDTEFGKGSTDEMCETIVLYYPAKHILGLYPWGCVYDVPILVCNASVTSDLLPSNDTIHRTFGTGLEAEQCSAKAPVQTGGVSTTDSDMGPSNASSSTNALSLLTVFALAVCATFVL